MANGLPTKSKSSGKPNARTAPQPENGCGAFGPSLPLVSYVVAAYAVPPVVMRIEGRSRKSQTFIRSERLVERRGIEPRSVDPKPLLAYQGRAPFFGGYECSSTHSRFCLLTV